MEFIALDFETANAKRSSICAIGIAVVRNRKIIKTDYLLIKPFPNYYASYNTRIHGISYEDTARVKDFKALWPSLKKYFQNKVIVAHNASFEISALRSILDEHHLSYPDLEYHCSLRLSQESLRLRSYALDKVARHLRLDLDHHQARSDAVACAEVVINFMKRKETHSLKALSKRCGFLPGYLKAAGKKHMKFSIIEN